MSSSILSTPLTYDDIARIANHLSVPIGSFVQNFVVATQQTIYDGSPNAQAHFKTEGPCPFLRQGLCGINKVKPQACRNEVPIALSDTLSCAEWHRLRLGWCYRDKR